MVSDGKAATAPYVSFRTFLNLLDRLQSGGIPQHIDRHYWGGFLAGSVGPQVMGALRFLGLINSESNEPTPMLERLVTPDMRKAALAEIVRERYAAVWDSGIDPQRTTPGHLESTMGRLYKIEGETRRKAVSFFIHAAKFADIPLSNQLTANTRQRRSTSTSTRGARPKGGSSTSPSGGSPLQEQHPPAPNDGPYAILHAWLNQLPPEGRWTQDRRERWITALQANVDFLIAVDDEPYDTDEDEEEE
jgi:hypothetical protein